MEKFSANIEKDIPSSKADEMSKGLVFHPLDMPGHWIENFYWNKDMRETPFVKMVGKAKDGCFSEEIRKGYSFSNLFKRVFSSAAEKEFFDSKLRLIRCRRQVRF